MTLHYLRRVLEPGLSGRCPSRFIHTDSGRYWFDLSDRWWTDVDDIRHLWQAARSHDASGTGDLAIAAVDRLLDYYSQGFLPEELYADAFADFRDTHDRGYDEALRLQLRLHRDQGHPYEVLTCAQRILDRDSYSECALAALVDVHLGQGNRAAAIAELDRFIRTQQVDLGARPSQRLLALRERVRRLPGPQD